MNSILNDIIKYDDIVIQCHDSPDADALSSGYALKWYLEKKCGKKVRLIYSGDHRISKSNLILMIDRLGIDIEYVREMDTPGLLVMVDCQYREKNVRQFDASDIAVIDHHIRSGNQTGYTDIRSNYGSCATVVFRLLKDAGVDINEDQNVATALYFGLMTDTNGFEEITHPADRDLRDTAIPRQTDIILFRNSNLSRDELKLAGAALEEAEYIDYKDYVCAMTEVAPCDPNILGIISDMLLEVDGVDICIVFNRQNSGVKLSVRSCSREIRANELADHIAGVYGNGGGNKNKAGGFMKGDIMEGVIPDRGRGLKDYFNDTLTEYFNNTEVIHALTDKVDMTGFLPYVKLPVEVGYVRISDHVTPGTGIMIRTMEGDIEIEVDNDTYIMIGIEGEIYPVSGKRFREGYDIVDLDYVYPGEYEPVILDTLNSQRIPLLDHASPCVSKGGKRILARQLDRRVKVFTRWDEDNYFLGKPGDYLAVRTDDNKDVYVVTGYIFDATYERVR